MKEILVTVFVALVVLGALAGMAARVATNTTSPIRCAVDCVAVLLGYALFAMAAVFMLG